MLKVLYWLYTVCLPTCLDYIEHRAHVVTVWTSAWKINGMKGQIIWGNLIREIPLLKMYIGPCIRATFALIYRLILNMCISLYIILCSLIKSSINMHLFIYLSILIVCFCRAYDIDLCIYLPIRTYL